MNLLAAAEHLARLEWSAPSLESQRCLYALDKYSNCDVCVGLCPTHAIEPGQPPKLVAERCVNCLACLTACPTGAFVGDEATPALINTAARAEPQVIELVCEAHATPETGSPQSGLGIRVKGCLAGLGPSAYIALVALGKSKIIVRTDHCAQCRLASLQPQIENQLEGAVSLLQAWGYQDVLINDSSAEPHTKVTHPVWEADNPPLSRRDLFQLASRATQVTLARTLAQDDGGSAHQPPRQRQRLLKALAHLPAGNQPGNHSVALDTFAALTVTPACTACGVCARACPTGALQFTEDTTQFQLSFRPQACIGCELCAHVCVPAALAVQPRPALSEVFGQSQTTLLQQGSLQQCPACHTRFAARPAARLCPVCEFRKENPFGARPTIAPRKARS